MPVKTTSRQAELEDYIARFKADGICDRFFYACASPLGTLSLPDGQHRSQDLWTGPALANRAVSSGLFEWLTQRVR